MDDIIIGRTRTGSCEREPERTGKIRMGMWIQMKKVFFFIGLAGLLGMLWGQEPAKTPKEGEKGGARVVDLAPVEGAAAPVDPSTYRIGPEDVLQIRVWRENELSGQFVVRPDGRITLPLAGELTVNELTPAEVQQKVADLYGKFVNKPEVSVSLARVGSKKYYLVGMVLRTGTFPLVVPTTVLEAINSAGGFQEFANKKKIVILRGNERLKFNYEEVIKGKNMAQNIQIQNGDHIIVQ